MRRVSSSEGKKLRTFHLIPPYSTAKLCPTIQKKLCFYTLFTLYIICDKANIFEASNQTGTQNKCISAYVKNKYISQNINND
jgi:hypothetical protein